jgi:hypothetical protein
MMVIPNPYKKSQNFQLQQQQQQQQPTMGIQSQRRDGSIASARRRGTKAKHKLKQTAISGGVAFAPHLHCSVCKARYQKARGIQHVTEPHRSHHKKCPKNRATRGLSARTVEVERLAEENILRNNVLYHTNQPILTREQAGLMTANYFIPRGASMEPPRPAGTSTPSTTVPLPATTTPASPEQGSVIRAALDDLMHKMSQNKPELDFARQSKYPTELMLSIQFVCSQLGHTKPTNTSKPFTTNLNYNSGRSKYRQFFQNPGSCLFTFPHEETSALNALNANNKPSPHYHNVAGDSFIYLDWKLIDPTVPLNCYLCHSQGISSPLHHVRTNFSKNKTLFPVWGKSGRPILSVVMIYKCQSCNATIWANDGRLLASLPTHLMSIYPVHPMYATGIFHLHRDLSDEMDNLMITYANGTKLSNMMFRRMGNAYEQKLSTYLSQQPTENFVSFNEFVKGSYPPSGRTLRDLFVESQHSKLTLYGYSSYERYEREIQSVEVDEQELVAIDWTFQVVKNYSLPGAKAMFTMNKGSTKEIVHLGIVRSTAVSQISHLVIKAKEKRRMFSPKALYSDITPHNVHFWCSIFGQRIVVLLGLFHCMHRVVDTLDPMSLLYWQVLVELKDCFYRYCEEDFRRVRECFMTGLLGDDGKKMTDSDITNLRRSKKWKQRYDPYLRKESRDEAMTCNMLSEWVEKYKDATDATGRSVFGRSTEKTTNEQKNKVRYVADPTDVTIYRKIPPRKKSLHDLPTWQSKRPESSLEKAHEAMAHFGNTAMRPEIADTLLLAGVANMNTKNRWACHVNHQRQIGTEPDLPLHFAFQPPFWDHSLCIKLNQGFAALNLKQPFDFVTPIMENNGEVFASKYFIQQEIRNKECGQDKKTHLCLCSECLPHHDAVSQQELDPAPPPASQMISQATRPTEVTQPTPTAAHPPQPTRMQLPMTTQIMWPQWQLPQVETFLLPHMQDTCFPYFPYFCVRKQEYLKRKGIGHKIMGKPPHDPQCPCKKSKH